MIGRKEEIKKIEALMSSNRSEFVAVTGRRRVGKTFLVDTLLKDQFCFSLTGIQNGTTQQQLINFSVKLAEYNGSFTPVSIKNWQIAFLQLKQFLKTLDTSRKHVIFIDELPWVSTARSGFIQMLAHFWNDYLSKEKHFLLVICGSATSWITKKIINDKGGLHNRVTEIIHLQPFTLKESYEFLCSKNLRLTIYDATKIYMVLGGIPFYLDNLRKGESFSTSIERICFSPNGILKNEYQNLYQALFSNAEIHHSIVELLASRQYGISRLEILEKLKKKDTGSYQRALEELVISDFVKEYIPFGKKKRGTFYRLVDEYSIFYHRFIKTNRKYTTGIWQQLATSQSYKIWSGFAFETLCFKHIDEIKKALGITSIYTETYSFRVQKSETSKGFQIDLIIDRNDNSINLCEIKFHGTTFTINQSYYHQLLQKRELFIEHTRTKKQVFITLITNYGLTQNDYATEIVDAEVILDDIIKTL